MRLLAYAGGLVLVGLMFMVIYEITMRYFFGRPFRGGYELTELAMSIIVAFGMPYTAIQRGHVTVDLFARWLDVPFMRWLVVLVHLVGAAVLALVAWRAWTYAMGSMTMGSLTNMMRVPKFPFQAAVAVSMGLFALVLLLDAVKAWAGPTRQEH
ncbi:MAG TPA: TRAP transporter small permease [Paracoccaceae bacterium]|nr:TRAP transporter small permease [Paracoccaceae bacterium]